MTESTRARPAELRVRSDNDRCGVSRRRVLKTLGLATAGSCVVGVAPAETSSTQLEAERTPQPSAPSWSPCFLDQEAARTVGCVADCVGHEPTAPGARRRAVRYVDRVLSQADRRTQRSFLLGLERLDAFAEHHRGRRFVALNAGERSRVLSLASDTHRFRQPEVHAFLTHLKQLTIEGYYSEGA